jgi:hypothetical protein
MAQSGITISALTATPTLRGNKLRASVVATGPSANLPALQTNTVEFWGSTVNQRPDPAGLSPSATGNPEALDNNLIEEQVYYYWARVRDNSGNYSDWFPSSPTAGVSCAAAGRANLIGGTIEPSIPGGALTLTIKTLDGQTPSNANPVFVNFDAVPATLPKATARLTGATSVTFPSGSSFGVAAASRPFRLWVCAVLKDGAFYLGAMNCLIWTASVLRLQPIPEGYVYAFSLVYNGNGGSINTGGTLYLNTAALAGGPVSSCQVRILGFVSWENGLASPGVFTALPSGPQLYAPGMFRPGDVVNHLPDVEITSGSASFNDTGAVGAKLPLPLDDTIPAYGERFYVTDFAVNVQSACNLMDVEAEISVAPDAASQIVALMIGLVNGDATAIGAVDSAGADKVLQVRARERVQAGTLTGFAREIGIGYSRTGVTSPSSCKVYYGRRAAGRLFGGIWNSQYSVKELQG